jgi:hypothetical protein
LTETKAFVVAYLTDSDDFLVGLSWPIGLLVSRLQRYLNAQPSVPKEQFVFESETRSVGVA